MQGRCSMLLCDVQGDALTVFTRNAALLATSMPPEAVRLCIVPLLVRAADQGGCFHCSTGDYPLPGPTPLPCPKILSARF